MKTEAILKSIDEAISLVESARYFSQHDMPESTQEKCCEAIGHLKATKLHLEADGEVPHESS